MNRDLKVDVLVCGGGMAGTAAAIAAGRAGADTLLVERWGFLGGSATAAAVGQFVGWETAAGRRVIRGIAEEIVERLVARAASAGHTHFTMSTGHRMDHVPYEPETLKVVLDELAMSAPARVLFQSMILAVTTSGRTIGEVALLTKAGPLTVRPRIVIDATGDLDVLARAGASFLPLAEGEALQPATMMFRFGPIDFASASTRSVRCRAPGASPRRGVAERRAGARRAACRARFPVLERRLVQHQPASSVDATDRARAGRAQRSKAGGRRCAAAAVPAHANVPGCEQRPTGCVRRPRSASARSRRIRGRSRR